MNRFLIYAIVLFLSMYANSYRDHEYARALFN